MKVAITCDYLLNRSHYTEIIESLCEVFPEATIYTLAHKQGEILGHIEQRSIKSTYLSNIVTTEEEFYSHSNKIPSLAKNLFVSCEYDLIINVSKGFSQGISKCKTTKQITYLYDLDLKGKVDKTLMQKLFSPFIKSWVYKTLSDADTLLVTREELLNLPTISNQKKEIVPPPFRVSDYALFPKTMFKHHFYLVESNALTINQAENIAAWMKEWEIPFQFIGNDEHLASLKAKHPENTFFGNRCSGEHAPVLAAAKALISFNSENFPALSLATMATGRPVILERSLSKWVSGVGIEFCDFSKASLKEAIDKTLSDEVLEGQKIRAHVMEYHDIKFKAQMKRILERAFREINGESEHSGSHHHEHSHDHTNCSGCK
jgi:hypothetical protein